MWYFWDSSDRDVLSKKGVAWKSELNDDSFLESYCWSQGWECWELNFKHLSGAFTFNREPLSVLFGFKPTTSHESTVYSLSGHAGFLQECGGVFLNTANSKWFERFEWIADADAPLRRKIHYMIGGNKKLKFQWAKTFQADNWSSTENWDLQSPRGNVDGWVIRMATSSFDPSAETPEYNSLLSTLNWTWRVDLPCLLMLNLLLHCSCLYSRMVDKKWEMQSYTANWF